MGTTNIGNRVSAGPELGLQELFEYPLMEAITERRTRRVCRGTSIQSGAISYESTNPPAPLTELEEAILIVSTGLGGKVTMHDVPVQAPDGTKQFSSPLLKILGRTASSADNAQATSFFMINDSGTWILRAPTNPEVMAALCDLPARWKDWRPEDWIHAAAAVRQRVHHERLDFPRRWPYYFIWNRELSNRPGSTIFFPVVDLTRQMINVILFLLSERDGERPLFVDDWQRFRPKSLLDFAAWFGSLLGLVPKIRYQIIGGAKRARDGFVNPNYPIPLGTAATMRTDYESFLQLQNLMLIAQSMGLGGWIHASVGAPYVFERDLANGTYGLGFRMEQPAQWRNWPPLPAPMPNPVGLDGILEGLCPPYVKSMNDAVDKVIEEKYGSGGAYDDRAVFARAYRKSEYADDFLKNAGHPGPQAVQYCKDICNYVFDTYHRFPAHVNAFHVPGVWVQFSHLEIEYYEKFYAPDLYTRQAEHFEIWGRH